MSAQLWKDGKPVKQEISGSIKIPLSEVPQSLLDAMLHPSRTLPVMEITLRTVITTDGVAMNVAWEGSFLEFDYVAGSVHVQEVMK